LATLSATSNWEGGWSAAIRDPRSPPSATFVLDLKSATLGPEADDEDSDQNKSEETLLKKVDEDVNAGQAVKAPQALTCLEETVEKEALLKETKKSMVSKEASKAKQPRKSVFGRMFARLSTSAHPSRSSFSVPSRAAKGGDDDQNPDNEPLLPVTKLPPQLDINMPSPGLKALHDLREPELTPADLVRALQSAKIPSAVAEGTNNNRATLPSTWKPHRPPSPIPKALKKGHKRNASVPSSNESPVPPLPTNKPRALPVPSAISIVQSSEVARPSSPLAGGVSSAGAKSNSWMDLQGRVRARAMKSSSYALIQTADDMISPPVSALNSSRD
jgi:hypothetical protein